MRQRLRSLVVPLTLKIIAVAVVLSALAFFTVYKAMQQENRAATLRVIDTDIAGLVDVFASEGSTGLALRVGDRLALQPEQGERPTYLVTDSNGHTIAGNLNHWPLIDAHTSSVTDIQSNDQHRVLARATVLRGGLLLLVGRSMVASDQRLAHARQIFVLALLSIAGAAAVIGYVTANALQGRIDAINQVLRRVELGELDARTTSVSDADEIDTLGNHVNRMLSRVVQLIDAQRDVTDHTAHETRTPLMHLDAELIKALAMTREPAMQTVLEGARGHIRKLLSLFDALLDIASAHALRGDVAGLKILDLTAIARSIIELYEPSAEDAGITLNADIAERVTMRGDPIQITRLFINLLDNAFKYGATGKWIGLSVQTGPIIIVEDRGIGIDPSNLKSIFDRYQRLPNAPSTGHGLGLSLVKAIAERHGLSVTVEDAKPGARFIIKALSV